ncbi:MAG: IS110 family transposase [Clostridia bacterium]
MQFVGIDIAKNLHYASVLDSDGVVLVKPFSFSNTRAGFDKLISCLSPWTNNELILGLESTAHYGDNLIKFLLAQNFNVALINPLQTSSLRKANIRNTKTDKVDTFLIAKSLMLNNYRLLKADISNLSDLKSLCGAKRNLTLLSTRSKIKLHAFVDQIFPELHNFFTSGIHIACSYALLSHYSSPKAVSKAKSSTLLNILSKASRGKYSSSKVTQLKDFAEISVGVNNDIVAFQIKQTVKHIQFIANQIDEIDKQINELFSSIKSPIASIPGVGDFNGAIICSFIGDITRFKTASQILAFAGLDPTVRQSGNFNACSTRMSKRGSGLLRYGIINACHNVVINNQTFKAYYDKKIAEGKRHYCALGHVANKLIRLIFTLLTKNISFNSSLCR